MPNSYNCPDRHGLGRAVFRAPPDEVNVTRLVIVDRTRQSREDHLLRTRHHPLVARIGEDSDQGWSVAVE
jgi:hypothetical protein